MFFVKANSKKSLKFVKINHVTCRTQSQYIICALCICSTQKFVYEDGYGVNLFKDISRKVSAPKVNVLGYNCALPHPLSVVKFQLKLISTRTHFSSRNSSFKFLFQGQNEI